MLIHAKSLEQAQRVHPGAAVYARVRNGYMVFDWPSEYAAWRSKR
jgi:hypothetical protein